MPRASTTTLLNLSRYAEIIGISPMHFCGGTSEIHPVQSCDRSWKQYTWQETARCSREYLADKIAESERDIADELGYWPAPVWIADERVRYEKPYRRDLIGVTGCNVAGRRKSVQAKWGQFLYGGQRSTIPLGLGVIFGREDYDLDGFEETAVFTILNVSADLDVCEVRAYISEADRTRPLETGPADAWEVRPFQAINLTGTTLTIHIYTWELFGPWLQEGLDAGTIDADDPNSYVRTLDFYRVYNDPGVQAQFLWGADLTCSLDAATLGVQAAYLQARDYGRSVVVPWPATYDAATLAFTEACWMYCYEPDVVRLWYRAGLLPGFADDGCELLDQFWAETIAILATARLDWPLCECAGVEEQWNKWREEMRYVDRNRSYQVDLTRHHPFGTRLGEVYAYERVKGRRRRTGDAVRI